MVWNENGHVKTVATSENTEFKIEFLHRHEDSILSE
jgi:hypothetical protein